MNNNIDREFIEIMATGFLQTPTTVCEVLLEYSLLEKPAQSCQPCRPEHHLRYYDRLRVAWRLVRPRKFDFVPGPGMKIIISKKTKKKTCNILDCSIMF